MSATNPSYYKCYGVESIEIIERLPFCIGSAVKYVWRCGNKGGPRDADLDMGKARWFMNRQLSSGEPLSESSRDAVLDAIARIELEFTGPEEKRHELIYLLRVFL